MNAAAPSRTAQYMALFRALESARPAGRRLFEDPVAASFLEPRLRAAALAAQVAPLRRLIVAFIDRRWPGPRLSAVVRTRVIDDFVNDCLARDCSQLVLLGAGYDTRATRLPAAARTVVFEVDHPATQQRKRTALGGDAAHVRYVAVDFETDVLAASLTAAGLDRGRPSCILWEGVFSYLTVAAIDRTLAALVELCAPGSRMMLTYVDERSLGAGGQRGHAWRDAVRDVGEPFITGLAPERAAAFFAARRLILRGDESTTEAARRLGVAEAETIPDMYRLAALELAPAGLVE
jgi:methyltransferase (TIGR00027 family)